MHDSVDGVSIILGKDVVDACFIFKVNDLLDTGALCEVNQEALDFFFKGG